MSKINPNDAAYPSSKRVTEKYMDEGGYGRERVVTVNTGGMTIRAEIAARIMAYSALYEYDADSAAEIAVHRADALIAELNRGPAE